MNQRQTVPFDMFSMRVDVPVSSLVRHRSFGWTCGQCALGKDGSVLHPYNLVEQVNVICNMISTVLERGDFEIGSVGKLMVYYVDSGADNDVAFAMLAERFPHLPIIVPIPVPHFYYDGMLVEIDVFTAVNIEQRWSHQDDVSSIRVVDAADQQWASVLVEIPETSSLEWAMQLTIDRLNAAGCAQNRLLCDHWFVANPSRLQPDVRQFFLDCDSVSSKASVVRINSTNTRYLRAVLSYSTTGTPQVIRTRDEHSNVVIVERSIDGFCWLSGYCDQGDATLVEQTGHIMASLNQSLQRTNRSFDDVAKLTAHYFGGATETELHENMLIRHRYYSHPGPASTGLPVAGFSSPDLRIGIDVVACY